MYVGHIYIEDKGAMYVGLPEEKLSAVDILSGVSMAVKERSGLARTCSAY
jgi:hypothetical protein